MKQQVTVGILAHVDAGKTTLAEAMLYQSGAIRTLGRVDHQNAFLDTEDLERQRGITIFSKQARLSLPQIEITLLDTPGHVDFSPEMERTLQVLDYAILVVNGAEGIQGQTEVLWSLLRRYGIPTLIFCNKMDQEKMTREELMGALTKTFSRDCIAFDRKGEPEFYEEVALCREDAMNEYLESGQVKEATIRSMLEEEELFPCYFGSALKLTGVVEFLDDMNRLFEGKHYPEEFGARVYKISRDSQKNRFTWIKITGGSLKVKGYLGQEKIDQIRLYSGSKYEVVEEVAGGSICAVLGPTKTKNGETFGIEPEGQLPVLEPVLTYGVSLPEGTDVNGAFRKIRELEEEIPELHGVCSTTTGQIHIQVMGQVQTQVLAQLLASRYDLAVSFTQGEIVYKETIKYPVEGVGHYEPLKHYAEVHLLLEPGEPGTGITCDTMCSEDILDRNWQRLVLTHIQERTHAGVLMGAELTDVHITLLSGKSHIHHTEGGDFRQATYRAIRQGLFQTESILLEPVYQFQLRLPTEQLGRAMTDIQERKGSFEPPIIQGEEAFLSGSAPVANMQDYSLLVAAYTGGKGVYTCSLKGYEPCHNQEEILSGISYDPEADLDYPGSSIFCVHGAGLLVPWYQVPDYMHLPFSTESFGSLEENSEEETDWELEQLAAENRRRRQESVRGPETIGDEEELKEIFQRTYGKRQAIRPRYSKTVTAPELPAVAHGTSGKKKSGEAYLLVDGYNMIFAWKELKELAEINIDSARDKLMDVLSNYQGYHKMNLILVFDAYKVSKGVEHVIPYHNILVVYTREAETADQYIEKAAHRMGKLHEVTVATSDAVEQIIIMGQGAIRMSAQELYREVKETEKRLREEYLFENRKGRHLLGEYLPKEGELK